MIITVTLNAAIDKSLSVPNFRLGRRHRTVEQRTMAGGKGVNIARTLKTLGQPVIATGFRGRRDGDAYRRAAHGGVDLERLRAYPRGVAHEHLGPRPDHGEQTEINERGPSVSERRSSCSATSCFTSLAAPRSSYSPAPSRAGWSPISMPC